MLALNSKVIKLIFALIGVFSFGRLMAEMNEYEMKAHFLCNFVKYTTWPKSGAADSGAVIGVLGDNPFGGSLKKFSGKTFSGRKLVVRYFPRFSKDLSFSDCQILFVSASERTNYQKVLKKIKGLPVLTVSDNNWFFRYGGMINFVSKNKRIRFSINRTVVEDAGLKLSSKLLRLAVEVK